MAWSLVKHRDNFTLPYHRYIMKKKGKTARKPNTSRWWRISRVINISTTSRWVVWFTFLATLPSVWLVSLQNELLWLIRYL